MSEKQIKNKELVNILREVGVQYALSKSRRHPSTRKYLMKSNDKTGMFDLDMIADTFIVAMEFIKKLGSNNHKILFVTNRDESMEPLRTLATRLGMPYVAGRWIGGTLCNFESIKGRIKRLQILRDEHDSEIWDKHTKKERIMLRREMANLNEKFYGLMTMAKNLPQAIFVVDPVRDNIAAAEARILNIPVIAIANADADINIIDYPIIANNNTKRSVTYILNEVESALKTKQQ